MPRSFYLPVSVLTFAVLSACGAERDSLQPISFTVNGTVRTALILSGRNDPLVKFTWQKRTMDVVRQVNGCASTGEPWDKQCTLYPSNNGTPLVTAIFPDGHQFNPAAPALIVKFFREHPGEATK